MIVTLLMYHAGMAHLNNINDDDLNNVGTIIQEHPWLNLTAAQISEKLRITKQYLTANNRTQELINTIDKGCQ